MAQVVGSNRDGSVAQSVEQWPFKEGSTPVKQRVCRFYQGFEWTGVDSGVDMICQFSDRSKALVSGKKSTFICLDLFKLSFSSILSSSHKVTISYNLIIGYPGRVIMKCNILDRFKFVTWYA